MRRVLFLIFVYSSFPIFPKNTYVEPNAVGSHLMEYFVNCLYWSLKGEEIPTLGYEGVKNNKEIQNFYNHLPKKIDLTSQEREILSNIPKRIWNLKITYCPVFYESTDKEHYLNYHRVLRTVSNRVIQTTLRECGYELKVQYPLIHYRLGDVPFCRNRAHHMNKYSYYLWALEKIASQGIDTNTVVVISSNQHRSNNKMQEACGMYLDDFVSFLNEQGYSTIIQSESILHDFASFVFAPAVISGSSCYSFMAGMASDGIFLSSKLGAESNRSYISFGGCEWMYENDPIFHYEIKDYYKIDEVIKKLRETEY